MTDETPKPEPPEHTITSEATFGMKKAAQVAGISVSTIRRNKELLRQHGAIIEPDGWKVPMSALIAADLMRARTPAEEEPNAGSRQQPDAVEHESVMQLQRDLERERHRAELAEERQRSAEREAESIKRELTRAEKLAASLEETLQHERRMLTASPETPLQTESERVGVEDDVQEDHSASTVHQEPTKVPRPSLFKRLFG